MSELRQIAVVRSYDDLHDAMRARAAELAVSRETIDAVSGLQSGYASKILAAIPMKAIGRQSLGPMLGALGLKLIVVEDCEALERVRSRLVRRAENRDWMLSAVQHEVVKFRFTRKHMRKIAKKSAEARLKKMPKWKRSRVARQAAKARWSKPRVVEIIGNEAQAILGALPISEKQVNVRARSASKQPETSHPTAAKRGPVRWR